MEANDEGLASKAGSKGGGGGDGEGEGREGGGGDWAEGNPTGAGDEAAAAERAVRVANIFCCNLDSFLAGSGGTAICAAATTAGSSRAASLAALLAAIFAANLFLGAARGGFCTGWSERERMGQSRSSPGGEARRRERPWETGVRNR